MSSISKKQILHSAKSSVQYDNLGMCFVFDNAAFMILCICKRTRKNTPTAIVIAKLYNLFVPKSPTTKLLLCIKKAFKKTPEGLKKRRRLPTLPLLRSTIGAIGLNFSVRNGKRWIPDAITTLIGFAALGCII